jgi:hypothetical protein
MHNIPSYPILAAVKLVLLLIVFTSCASKKPSKATLYMLRKTLYVDRVHTSTITEYKTLAILPPDIILNTRYPGTDRAIKRSILAAEHRNLWMEFHYKLFRKHAGELKLSIQPPDKTLALLQEAGVALDSLHFINRQRLIRILNVDALFVHDFEINIYSSTTQNVVVATGAVMILAAGVAGGLTQINIPQLYPANSSIEFIKVYGKGIDTPIWSYYGLSAYNGKKAPQVPEKSSLNYYRYLYFPLLKNNKL